MTRNGPDPAQLALGGLRVLEIGTGPALAYAGKLFADFGAEVIKVEDAAGDAWRRMPPLIDPPAGGQPESALFGWLNTNKRSVVASGGPEDGAWLARLARTCDVVLDARALDAGIAVLERPVWRAPGEPHGHVPIDIALTWFGESGPYSEFAGTEAVCRGLAGAVHGSGPVEGPGQ